MVFEFSDVLKTAATMKKIRLHKNNETRSSNIIKECENQNNGRYLTTVLSYITQSIPGKTFYDDSLSP